MHRGWIATLLLAALGSSPAFAQDASAPKKKSVPLKVTFQVRLRLESWDWFYTSRADRNYQLFASQLRVGIGQERKPWDWQLELEQPTLLGLPDDAVAPAPQGQLGLGASYFAANHNERNTAGIFLTQVYGAYTRTAHKKTTGEWRAFAFHYHDGRGELKVEL